MRARAKTDSNQPDIVDGLRSIGASVQILAAVGKGCPDLLIGYRGVNVLLEIKDGAKSPSRRELTDDQVIWHGRWNGQVASATNLEEAIAVVQIVARKA
jgi:hypothetical protein